MAILKEIRNRVGAIKSIEKITSAMKMIAAAKLRKAQDMILSARPFAFKLDELFEHIIALAEDSNDELLKEREVKSQLIIVVTSDRGLAGAFNTNILRYAEKLISEAENDIHLITIGKKSSDYFKKHKYNIIEHYVGIFDNLNFELSREIVQKVVEGYLEHKYDKVQIIYNEFKSIIKQNIICKTFLPFELSADKKDNQPLVEIDYIYEPGLKEILNYLIPRQLNIQFWKILLESNAAEQGARMTAMETATNNANDLMKELNIAFNRARQDAITTELIEIVGGAEALQGD